MEFNYHVASTTAKHHRSRSRQCRAQKKPRERQKQQGPFRPYTSGNHREEILRETRNTRGQQGFPRSSTSGLTASKHWTDKSETIEPSSSQTSGQLPRRRARRPGAPPHSPPEKHRGRRHFRPCTSMFNEPQATTTSATQIPRGSKSQHPGPHQALEPASSHLGQRLLLQDRLQSQRKLRISRVSPASPEVLCFTSARRRLLDTSLNNNLNKHNPLQRAQGPRITCSTRQSIAQV